MPAHLTLFHHLPGSEEAAIRHLFALACRHQAPTPLTVTGLRSLGNGVAYTLDGAPLVPLRTTVAREFHGALTAQDRQAWRPHVTIQNKADPATARALLAAMQAEFAPFTVQAEGLLLWRYLAGPWEPVETLPFIGAAPAPPP